MKKKCLFLALLIFLQSILFAIPIETKEQVILQYESKQEGNEQLEEKVYVTSVTQNGEEVIPLINDVSYNTNGPEMIFYFNNTEPITVHYVGKNLDSNATYQVNDLEDYDYYTGADLEKGIDITINPKSTMIDGFTKSLGSFANISENIVQYRSVSYQKDGKEYSEVKGKFYAKGKMNMVLLYENKIIEGTNSNWVSGTYDTPVTFQIKAMNLKDQDYTVKVSVSKKNLVEDTKTTRIMYQDDYTINGLELNNGYQLTIKEFKSPTTTKEWFDTYNILVWINGVSGSTSFEYQPDWNYMNQNIYYKELGNELPYFGAGGFKGKSSYSVLPYSYDEPLFFMFKSNSQIKFEEDTTYTYEFSYGQYDDSLIEPKNKVVVKSETILGNKLNQEGIMVSYKNPSNYSIPAYQLIIKKDDVIVLYSQLSLEAQRTDDPYIETVNLTSNNQKLLLSFPKMTYTVSNYNEVKLQITSVNCSRHTAYPYQLSENGTIIQSGTFSGKDLNAGDAVITLPTGINEIKTYQLEFLPDQAYSNYIISSSYNFKIEYASPDKFLNTAYIVEEEQHLMKNIDSNTRVSNFKNNIKLSNEGTITVSSNEEEKNDTDMIGTGMKAQIKDLESGNILELETVVKGDTTGDGLITEEDLNDVRNHLSGNGQLEGIYKQAGDFTNTGEINLLDLVKMNQEKDSNN